jgi:hypothetical protein
VAAVAQAGYQAQPQTGAAAAHAWMARR